MLDFYTMFNHPLLFGLGILTIIASMFAQYRVKAAYEKYSQVRTHRGISGEEAARKILDSNGLRDVEIRQQTGLLSDHYDPRDNSITLSADVFGNTSIAAVAVAAHECGHAIQYKEKYSFIALRNIVLPGAIFSSKFSIIIFLAGMFISRLSYVTGGLLMWAGIIAFSLTVAFQLFTLPMEYDASNRAKVELVELGIVSPDEMGGVQSMLGAAAMTYVAALAVSVVQLLRLLAIANDRRR